MSLDLRLSYDQHYGELLFPKSHSDTTPAVTLPQKYLFCEKIANYDYPKDPLWDYLQTEHPTLWKTYCEILVLMKDSLLASHAHEAVYPSTYAAYISEVFSEIFKEDMSEIYPYIHTNVLNHTEIGFESIGLAKVMAQLMFPVLGYLGYVMETHPHRNKMLTWKENSIFFNAHVESTCGRSMALLLASHPELILAQNTIRAAIHNDGSIVGTESKYNTFLSLHLPFLNDLRPGHIYEVIRDLKIDKHVQKHSLIVCNDWFV